MHANTLVSDRNLKSSKGVRNFPLADAHRDQRGLCAGEAQLVRRYRRRIRVKRIAGVSILPTGTDPTGFVSTELREMMRDLDELSPLLRSRCLRDVQGYFHRRSAKKLA